MNNDVCVYIEIYNNGKQTAKTSDVKPILPSSFRQHKSYLTLRIVALSTILTGTLKSKDVSRLGITTKHDQGYRYLGLVLTYLISIRAN